MPQPGKPLLSAWYKINDGALQCSLSATSFPSLSSFRISEYAYERFGESESDCGHSAASCTYERQCKLGSAEQLVRASMTLC